MHALTEKLISLKDDKYRAFHSKLVAGTIYPIMGVRVPDVRKAVKALTENERASFLTEKHVYYEEILAHGLIIAAEKDADKLFGALEEFLPLIDNWAICDTVAAAVKIRTPNKEAVFARIKAWIQSDKTYIVRFAIVLLLTHFTDEENIQRAADLATHVVSEEYYINMAVAWFISVVLVKNYDLGQTIIKRNTLSPFVRNASIRKACDSFRISKDKKTYLKNLKI